MQAGSFYNVYSIIAHCCVCVCVGGGVVCVRVGRWADVISKCAAIFDHPLTFLFFCKFLCLRIGLSACSFCTYDGRRPCIDIDLAACVS